MGGAPSRFPLFITNLYLFLDIICSEKENNMNFMIYMIIYFRNKCGLSGYGLTKTCLSLVTTRQYLRISGDNF